MVFTETRFVKDVDKVPTINIVLSLIVYFYSFIAMPRASVFRACSASASGIVSYSL